MKILVVPDSMKDCLSAIEAAKIMKEGILEVFPFAQIVSCPLSDGGEGLVEVLYEAGLGKKIKVEVEDSLGRNIQADILELENKGDFLIEMAQAAGLQLLAQKERNPLKTSTRGVGQMIAHAIDSGARKIYIGMGGSATHDLGCGMAEALGAKFYDINHKEISPRGANLLDISKVDLTNLNKLKHLEFIGITDVESLLLGKDGAANTFALQKGAEIQDIKFLENGSKNVTCLFKNDNELILGSGAAGGLGFGVVTFLGGTLLKGVDVLKELTLLDEKIVNSNIVITLEGKTDKQTLLGKLPYTVARLAKQHNKRVIHYTGFWDKQNLNHLDHVFDVVMSIQDKPMTLEDSIRESPFLLKQAVIRSFKLLKMGVDFNV